MNLKAFMKEELKSQGTMEFPGIEKFKDKNGEPVPFIIKRLSRRQIREIRELYHTTRVYRDKNNGDRPLVVDGQVSVIRDYDAEKAGLQIMVDAFLQPKLDDPELMEYYGVLDRLDMPDVLFQDRKDYQYANECVMAACGLADRKKEEEVIEDIKN